MQLILAADIFGRTSGLDEMAGELEPLTAGTVIIDPYKGAVVDFKSEDQAYAYFQQHVGLDRYAQAVIEDIGPAPGPLLMVGFSVGASAIWVAAAGMNAKPNAKALCFYGSQIRLQQDLIPAIDVEMFFPREEPHFDVEALRHTMAEKSRVTCHSTEYLHGFMNRRSKNFSPAGYKLYLSEIEKRLETL